MEKYHPWSEHNKALSNPHYRMEGLMDCFREEVSFSMPYRPAEVLPQVEKQPEPQWSKRQWAIVQQLKGQVLFLSNKVNEMRAKASKRKRKDVI